MRPSSCAFLLVLSLAVTGARSTAGAQVRVDASNIRPEVKVQKSATAALGRKVRLLEAAGIRGPAPIRTPITLSVRTPWIDGSTNLDFFQLRNFSPSTEYASLDGNKETGASHWVEVRWPADRRTRYILDCVVGGYATRFKFKRSRKPQIETMVTRDEDRVGIVTGAGDGAFYILGMTESWNLKSCEITPIG